MTESIASVAASAYVHVPFCQHRCGYCDFSIIANRRELVPRYLRALELELQQQFPSLTDPMPLDTLFIGGGTPTLLNEDELSQLLDLLQRFFCVDPQGEFSFEANPDLFTVEKQDLLTAAGVNRISLGVQSFDDQLLHTLERTHSAELADEVIRQVKSRFSNFSVDLIFALPGQSEAHWQQTLRRALEYAPPHISTYALTFEKGTQFWSKRDKGQLHSAEEVAEAAMYEFAVEQLPAAGLRQYEISNFARPGYESWHNEVYWIGQPFYAFGPGAARFIDGQRSGNHRSPFTWMKRLEAGNSPTDWTDNLTREQRARELFAIGLRRNDGIHPADFAELTGFEPCELLTDELQSLIERDWLTTVDEHYRLTATGRLFADAIAAEVI